MSSIDERIVKMTFDNDKFQSGVQKTMDILDKLKEKLAFKNFDNTFKGIEVSANSVNLDGISSGVDNLQKRFSTLGIVGMEVTKRITNAAIDAGKKINDALFGQIKSGGMKRALNIEQAMFQLKGLGLDAEKIKDNALEAVKGTAYGLDEAAKAASVLGASGVKAGKEMTDVLKSISGAAAMTGRNFGDIADIYSTVASNGKLMLEQIRQFSHSGLNVTAVLQKYYHATGEEVQEMVKKGQVSFDDFSKAMQSFGEHAKKANETYTGALSNMKAALSRIGALFATPYIENMRDIFNVTTKVFDHIAYGIEGFANRVGDSMKKVTKSVTTALRFLAGKEHKGKAVSPGTIGRFIQGIAYSFEALASAIAPIKKAFMDIFPNATLMNLLKVSFAFRKFTKNLALNETQAKHMEYAYKGVFSVIKLVGTVVKTLIDGVRRLTKPFGGLLNIIITILGVAGRIVTFVTKTITKIRLLSRIFTAVTTVLGFAFTVIVSVVKGITNLITVIKNSKPVVAIVNAFRKVFEAITNTVGSFVSKVKEISRTIGSWIGSKTIAAIGLFVNLLSKGLGSASKVISKVVNKAKELFAAFKNSKFVTGFIKTISNSINTAKQYLSQFVNTLKNAIGTAIEWVKEHDVVQKFFSALSNGLQLVVGALIIAGSKIKDFAKKAIDFFKETGLIEKFTELFHKGMEKVKDGLKTALEKIQQFGDYIKTHLRDKLNSASDAASNLKDNLKASVDFSGFKNSLKKFVEFLEQAGSILEGFGKLVGGFVWKYIGPVVDAIVGVLSNLATQIIGYFKNVNFKEILDYFPYESLGIFLLFLSKFVNKAAGIASSITGAFDSISGAFDAIKEKIGGGSKWRKRAKTLLMFAGALAVFTAAVVVLGSLDTGTLAKGLVSVAIGMTLIVASIAIIGKALEKFEKVNFAQVGVGMIGLSLGVLALAKAVSLFASLDITTLVKGFLSVAVSLLMLSGAVRLMGNPEHMLNTAAGLLVLNLALLGLANVLKLYSKFDWEKTFGPGLLAVSAMLLVLAGSIRLMGNPKHMFATGLGILAMATALKWLSSAVEVLGSMDWKVMVRGLAAVISVILAFGVSVRLMAATDMKGVAKSIQALVLALVVITFSIKMLSKLDTANMIVGFVGLAGMLIAMAGALRMLNGIKDLGKSVVSLLALSAAIVAIGVAVKVIAQQPLANIAVALGGLIVMIFAMVGALKLLSGVEAGGASAVGAAAAMAIMAASIIVLSGALMVLSSIPVNNLAASVGLLAATLLVLAGVGALAGFPLVSAGLMALSVALLAIGTTVLLASMGISLLVSALTELSEMGPEAMQSVVDSLVAFMASLAAAAPQLAVSAVTIVSFFIAGLLSLIPAIAMAGVSMIIALLGGIAANIGTIAAMAGMIIAEFLLGISAMLPTIINAGLLLVTGFILGMADGIRNNSKLLFDAVKSLLEAIMEMFLNFLQTLTEKIPVVGDKISKGLEGAKESLREAFNVEDIDSNYKKSLEKADSDIKDATPKLGNSSKEAKEAITGPFKDMDIGSEVNLDSLATSITDKKDLLKGAASESAEGIPEGYEEILGDIDFGNMDPNQLLAGSMDKNSEKPKNSAKKSADGVIKEYNRIPGKAKSSGSKINKSFAGGISSKEAVNKAKKAAESVGTAFGKDGGKSKKSGEKLSSNLSKGIDSKKDSVTKSADNLASGAANAAGSHNREFNSVGSSMASGLQAGFDSMINKIIAHIQAKSKEAANAAKKGAKVNSPSKISMEAGIGIGEGIIVGVNKMANSVYDSSYNLGKNAANSLTDAMSKVYDILNSDMDMNPTITPVLDLSNVNKGVRRMNGMLDTRKLSTSVSTNMSGLRAMSGNGYLGGNTTSNNTSNTFNIHVDGTENPELFADRLVRQIRLRERMS